MTYCTSESADDDPRDGVPFPGKPADARVEDLTVELQGGGRPAAPGPIDIGGEVTIGRVLRDRYVIVEKLASGGKGTVFKALDRYRTSLVDSQRYVALKVLHGGGAGAAQTLKHLSREVEIGQALSHRNIVKMFELDRDGDTVFFTMELLEGELLSSPIARMAPNGLRRSQAWQIIRQLGAGVQHAHDRGVAHGDLKPRNILLTHDGELRILDFGTARQQPCTSGDFVAAPGEPVSGTPAYASCELLEGRGLDPRDDLYAVACIAYELLTSTHPFAHRTAVVARNYGVKATRPEGITSRQWRILRAGFSWHRAGWSAGVGVWAERLTHGVAPHAAVVPSQRFMRASFVRPVWHSRAAAAALAVVLIGGATVRHLRAASRGTLNDGGASAMAANDARAPAASERWDFTAPVAPATPVVPAASEPRTMPGSASLVPASSPLPGLPPGSARENSSSPGARKLSQPPPLRVSVDGYQVSSGERFVEVRVHRNQWRQNASFIWWTEAATAKPDVDFVHQGSAVQTFAAGRRSTRFYVKLLPETLRLRRDYFYIAIAQPGDHPTAKRITRAQIWLPAARDPLQARR